MAVREWRPGYGSEPVRQFTRPKWSYRNAWHKVWCPRPECPHAEGFLVYAPVATDGRQPVEKYACAVCQTDMRQERVRAGRA